jgi:sulfate permease, SulP family
MDSATNRGGSGSASSSGDWVGDAWGGLAAMLVALPSAIAFGVAIFSALAGSLAAQGALAGILGATALGLLAPPFGSRSRLISAPSAPAAAVLAALATTFTQQGGAAPTILIQIGIIGLLAGIIQVGFGTAGIGRLIKFIPFPVVSGYLSGVGLIIIGSQLPKFVGAPAGASLLGTLRAPSAWMWQSILVGTIVIATMVLTPRLTKAVPAAILALLAGCATYLVLALIDPALMTIDHNPLVIGALSSGDAGAGDALSRYWLAIQSLGFHEIAQVLAPALTLATLLSIDTLKTGLVMDTITNSHHDPDRELIGQGIGNMAASIVGGVPGSGTMGASLVNLSSGAKTWRSALMAGGFSLLAFLLLSGLIAWVPIAALAGILIVIGFRMIDRHSLTFFFTPATRLDFLVILAVILEAVFGNLVAASALGVALAIILFIREQTRSSVVRHRIEGQEIVSKRTRSELELSGAEADASNMVVFELQGSLFFGTANQLQTALEPEASVRKYIVLSMRRVQSLDVTATHVLEQIKDKLEQHHGYLVFCDIPKGLPSGLKMKRFLKDTGVVRPTNSAFAFRQLDDALEWIESQEMAEKAAEPNDNAPVELADMPFLAGCSPEAMTALAAVVELRLVKEGKRVFKAGGDSDALYFLRRGAVKLTVPIHKKESYHLATCGPGDLIGAKGFIEVHRQAMDALALADSDVYVLTREQFEVLAVDFGDLAVALVGKLARDLATRLHTAITEVQVLRG